MFRTFIFDSNNKLLVKGDVTIDDGSSNYIVLQSDSSESNCLRVNGNAKIMSNAYVLSNLGVSTSNPTEKLDVIGNIKASSNLYVLNAVGITNSNPTEKLDVSGSTKVRSNLYVLSNVAIGSSNPTENLDIKGNVKTSSNLYVMSKIGVNTSNPAVGLEVNTTDAVLISKGTTNQRPSVPVQGHVRYNTDLSTFEGFGSGNVWGSLGGVKDTNQDTYVSAETYPTSNDDNLRFINSNIESMRITNTRLVGINISNPTERLDVNDSVKVRSNMYVLSNIGINTSNTTEKLDIIGNLKTSSNIYAMNAIGIASSNPSERLDIVGNLKTSSNAYIMSRIGVANSNPSERLDITGNLKASVNVYAMNLLGVATSNPSESIDVVGNFKASSNAYVMSRIGVATSNPNESIDVIGNFKASSNAYVMNRIGIANSNPSERLDISGNLKTSSNIYAINAIGVATSNPSESIDVVGNFKASSNAYVMSRIGVATSNPTESIDVIGNLKASSNAYVMSRIGVATSNPNERLDIIGNLKASVNVYAMSSLGVATSNPSESIDVIGNLKASSNAYVMSRIGVANSNPSECIDVTGNLKSTSNIYAMNLLGVSTSNPSESIDVIGNFKASSNAYIMSRIGVANSNPSESLDIIGNFKASSNAYIMSRIGIATSNPSERLDIAGNVKASSNAYIMSRIGVATSNPAVGLEVNTTDAVLISKGTSSQRPSAPVQGHVRYNTDLSIFEGFGSGNVWGSLGGVKDTNQDTYVSAETYPTSNDDNLRFINSNIESMRITNTRLVGINVSNPTERLDVNDSVKVRSNLYVLSNIGINTSNTTEKLDIVGNLKTSSNIYAINAIGIANSNPSERLDVTGNLKATSNIYALNLLGIGNSNPSERLDVVGNIKASSNAYFMSKIGISTSNPLVGLEVNTTDAVLISKGTSSQRPSAPVQGHVRYNTDLSIFEGFGSGNVWGSLGGVKDTNQDTYVSAETYPTSNDDNLRFINSNIESMRITNTRLVGINVSNPTERLDVNDSVKVRSNLYVLSNIGINTSNTTEKLDIIGNLKTSSNIYAINAIGIANSNPSERLDVVGNLKASSNAYVMSKLGIATSNPAVGLEVNTTDAVLVSKGTTAQRPSISVLGHVRYNTDLSQFEGFGAGSAWGSLGGVKDTNQDTYISAESYPTSNDDILRFFNSNIESMRITNTGYVGIGTASPSEMLSVTGNIVTNNGIKSLSLSTSNIQASNIGTSNLSSCNILVNTIVASNIITSNLVIVNSNITTTNINANETVNTSNVFTSNLYASRRMVVGSNATANWPFDLVVLGKAFVQDITTLSNTLDVSGATTLSNTLNVSGVTTLSNALTTYGISTLSNAVIVSGITTLSNNLNVSGAMTLSNTLNVSGATLLSNSLTTYNGTTTHSNALTVSGVTTLSNNVNVSGAITLSNTLNVSGATLLSNSLTTYNGTTTHSNALTVFGVTTLSNNLNVSGALTLSNTLNVSGATLLSNSLTTYNGTTTLSNALTTYGISTLSNAVIISGATTLSNTLNVSGATLLSNTLVTYGVSSLSNNLNVSGAMTLSNTLNVSGATLLSNSLTTYNGTTTHSNALTVSGVTTLSNALTTYGISTLSNAVIVSGITTLSNNLNVSGPTTLSNTLNVSGATLLSNTLVTYGVSSLSNNLNVSGPMTLSNTLNVSGATLLSNALTTYNGTTTHSNALIVSGITTLSNNLNVSGAMTLSNTLNVSGATLLSNSLTTYGISTLSNALIVSGVSTLSNNVNVSGPLTLSNNLNVSGVSLLSNALTTYNGTTTHSNALIVSGITTLSNNLNVSGALTLSNTLNVSGAALLSNTLTTYGITNLSNNVNISGPVSLSNTLNVSGAALLSNTLTTYGITNFSNNVNVSGPVSLSNTLNVSGATVLSNALTTYGVTNLSNNVNVSGPLSLSNTLNVSGVTVLSNALTTYNGPTTLSNAVIVSGAFTLSNTMNVSGATLLSNTLVTYGATTHSNTLTVSGGTTLSNTLNVSGATLLSNVLTTYNGTTTHSNNVVVSGNVGLGTNAPNSKLDVRGAIYVDGAAGTYNNVGIASKREYFKFGALEGASGSDYARIYGEGTNDSGKLVIAIQDNADNSEALIFRAEKYDGSISRDNMYIRNDGLVGIGNSTPTEKLHVTSGKIYSDTQLLGNSNDSASIPSFSFKENSNTGIFHATNDAIGFTTNGTEKMRIDTTGNVGIRTTTPVVGLEINTTDAVLIPKGTIVQRPSVPVLGHIRYNTETSQFEGFGSGSTWGSLGGVKDTNQDTYISVESYPTSNDDNIRFYNSNVASMCILNGGNVGIGTSNPTYKLDVSGTVNAPTILTSQIDTPPGGGRDGPPSLLLFTQGGVEQMRLENGQLGIGTNGSPSYSLDVPAWGRIGILATNIIDVGDQGDGSYIKFTDGQNELARIFNTNLGINTINPIEKIHVSGKIYSDTQHLGTSNDSASLPSFTFLENSNTGMFHASNDAIGFATSGSEKLRIDTIGNVGIGLSNPSYKLDVSGVINSTSIQGPTITALSNLGLYGSNTAYWSSNNLVNKSGDNMTGTLTTTMLGVSTTTPTEKVDVVGNAKVSSNLYVGGSIGVGTSNPSQPLHVVGNARIEGNLDVNGIFNTINTDVQVTDQFTVSNNGTGPALKVYQMGAEAIADFFDDNNIAMRIADGGVVGIGTSNPAYKLDVNGEIASKTQIRIRGGTNYSAILRNDDASTFLMVTAIGNQDGNWNSFRPIELINGTGQVKIGNGALSVQNGGNVGIGNASPAYKLDVTGTANFNGNVSVLSNSLSFGSLTRQMLNLYGTNYGIGVQNSTTYMRTAIGFAWFKGGVHSDTAYDAGTGGATQMTLDINGQLKITSLAPMNTSNLYINSTYGLQTTSNGLNVMIQSACNYIYNPGSAGGSNSYAKYTAIKAGDTVGSYWGGNPSVTGADIVIQAGNVNLSGNNGSAPVFGYGGNIIFQPGYAYVSSTAAGNNRLVKSGETIFYYANTNGISVDSNLTEAMRIGATGNVGIGVSNPAYNLDVTGSIRLGNSNSEIKTLTSTITNAVAGTAKLTFASGGGPLNAKVIVQVCRPASGSESTLFEEFDVSWSGILSSPLVITSVKRSLNWSLASYQMTPSKWYYDSTTGTITLESARSIQSTGTFQMYYTIIGRTPLTTTATFDANTPPGTIVTSVGFIIDENSNVGIGTSTPAYKLDVNGIINSTSIQGPTITTLSNLGLFGSNTSVSASNVSISLSNYVYNTNTPTITATQTTANWSSNLAVGNSNKAYTLSNYVYGTNTPSISTAQTTANWSSNVALYGSNTVYWTSNTAIPWTSNAAIFGSNTSVSASNVSISLSNYVYGNNTPSISTAQTTANWSSNAALYGSNTAYWTSNTAIPWTSNASVFGSNTSVSASNVSISLSNYVYNTNTPTITATQTTANWSSNAALYGSNTAYWTSNNHIAKTGGAILGNFDVNGQIRMGSFSNIEFRTMSTSMVINVAGTSKLTFSSGPLNAKIMLQASRVATGAQNTIYEEFDVVWSGNTANTLNIISTKRAVNRSSALYLVPSKWFYDSTNGIVTLESYRSATGFSETIFYTIIGTATNAIASTDTNTPPGTEITAANFVINENSNVGIGTSTPAYKLDVVGTINSTDVISGPTITSLSNLGLFGSNTSVSASNVSISLSNYVYNTNTPTITAVQTTANWSSNASVFGSNTSVSASNVSISLSNYVYNTNTPTITAAQTTANWSSNASVFGSNTSVSASNVSISLSNYVYNTNTPSITAAQTTANWSSNIAVGDSNKSYALSNYVYGTNTPSISAAQTTANWSSNTALYGSNNAVWASNNLLAKSGDIMNGLLSLTSSMLMNSNDNTYIGVNALGLAPSLGIVKKSGFSPYFAFTSNNGYAVTGNSMFFGMLSGSNLGAVTDCNLTTMMTLTNAGNFGIGTTNPSYKLDVSGTFRSTGNGILNNAFVGDSGYVNSWATFQHKDLALASGNYAIIQQNTGQTILNASSGQTINFRNNNTDQGAWSTTGLGIGTTTPAYKLDVVGNRRSTGFINLSYTISFDTTANGIRDIVSIVGGATKAFVLEVSMSMHGGSGKTMSKHYKFACPHNSTNGTWQRCLPFSGGKTGTDSDLELQLNNTNATSSLRAVHVTNTISNTTTVNIRIEFPQNDPPTITDLTQNAQYTDVNIATLATYSLTQITQISGNVGIGLSNPAYKLDVSGVINSTSIQGPTITALSNLGLYGSNTAYWTSNTAIPWTSNASIFGSNTSVSASNVSISLSNYVYNTNTPSITATQTTANFASNIAVGGSNKSYALSNYVYGTNTPNITTTQTTATWSSNTALYGSNTSYWSSNTAIPWTSNASVFGSNTSVSASNVSISLSNYVYNTNTPSITVAQTTANWSSNAAVLGSNSAVWSSNNLLKKSGDTMTGLLTLNSSMVMNTNDNTYIGINAVSVAPCLGIIKKSGYSPYFAFTSNNGTGTNSMNFGMLSGSNLGAVASCNLTTMMTLTNAGNFGIGISNPSYPLDVVGTTRGSGEFISTSTNAFRMIQGNYGGIWRNDGGNTYFLLTASGDQYGNWNTLRPIMIYNGSGTISFGNNALYVIHGGNVGVGGTTSPSEKLHVASGKIFSDTQILGTSNDDVTLPSHSFKEDSNTGMFYAYNDTLGFTAGGIEAARMDAYNASFTSNVNVGSNLNVTGNLQMNNRLTIRGLQITRRNGLNANVTNTALFGFSNANNGIVLDVGSNAPASNQSLRITWSNNTERMRINGAGYLGLGTSNPNYNIHVASNTNVSTPVVIAAENTNSSSWSGFTARNNISVAYGGLRWGMFGTTFGTNAHFYQSSGFIDCDGSNGLSIAAYSNTGEIRFYSGGSTERMRLSSTGNLGIGTTTPYTNLHVNNDFHIAANSAAWNSTAGKGIYMKYSTTGGQDAAYIQSITRSTQNTQNIAIQGSNIQLGGLSDVGVTPSLYVQYGGNVGIGTSTPGYKLDVNGTTNLNGNVTIPSSSSLSFGLSARQMLNLYSTTYGMGIQNSTMYYRAANSFAWFKGGVHSDTQFDAGSGGAVQMVLDTNGNLGIGTTSPAYKLDVNGTTRTSTLMFSQLNAGYSNMSHWNFGTTGDWYVRSVDNAGKVILQDTGGNVGIGTSSPSYKLDVTGTTNLNGNVTIPNPSTLSFGTTARQMVNLYGTAFGIGTQNYTMYSRTGDSFAWFKGGVHSGTQFDAGSGGAVQMVLDTNGNLGIGTTSPATKLQVNHDFHIAANSSDWNSTAGKGLYMRYSTNGGQDAAYIQCGNRSALTLQNMAIQASNIQLGTTEVGVTPALYVQYGGNVGLGTSTPSYKLDVSGTLRSTGNGIINTTLVGDVGYTGWTGIQNSSLSTSAGNYAIIQSTAGQTILNAATGQSILFAINNGSSGAWTTTGFGVGTTSPSYKLDVSGSIRATGNCIFNTTLVGDVGYTGYAGLQHSSLSSTLAGNFAILQSSSGQTILNASTGQSISFRNNNGDIGAWSTTGLGVGTTSPSYKLHVSGDIYSTGNVTAYSDIRAKSNLEVINSPIDKISKLTGYTYEMISPPDLTTKITQRYTGIVAQDLQKVLPEAVHKDRDGNYSVAYGNMAGLFVEAIKELTVENKELKNTVLTLEERISKLESIISTLM